MIFMKLYLTQDVPKLGIKGDKVRVSDGYGRNYLIAKGLAAIEKVEAKPEKVKTDVVPADLEKFASIKTPITINAPAAETGKLYAKIGNKEIVEAIKKQLDINIPPEMIKDDEVIKTTGAHKVLISHQGTPVNTLDLIVNNQK